MLTESPEKNTPRLAGQICRSLIHLGLLSPKPGLAIPVFGSFLPRLNFRGWFNLSRMSGLGIISRVGGDLCCELRELVWVLQWDRTIQLAAGRDKPSHPGFILAVDVCYHCRCHVSYPVPSDLLEAD